MIIDIANSSKNVTGASQELTREFYSFCLFEINIVGEI